ncbi:MAG: PIN domain-containing protein [Elusimicrobia bacterium]|nr:PIN domain-containing protein [Elusimicrobiota bacterium]
MRVLFDTSVLVAAVVEAHAMHGRAFLWLKRAKAKEYEFLVSSHTVAELYAVLTSLPLSPKISPGTAWRLVHENVGTVARTVALSASDYESVVKRMAERGLTGGLVYDALIAQAARKSGADRLLTLNADDFKRVWPEGASAVIVP